ncbi:hypothetical protein ACGFJ7_20550 [Actinoplanes sp. NPDC048988]|uniref:hypothetical protein n=1 Tax=Actinoplanes sp. NPDC048988 TaxID=3363901 RepID=UPI003712A831
MSTRIKVLVTVAALVAVTWWAATTKNVLGAIVVGLFVNEFGELSPWLARHLVNWAAYRWTADPRDAADLSREWQGIIDQRPGKLFKLFTAAGFASSAGATVARPALARFWRGRAVRGAVAALTTVGALTGAVVFVADRVPADNPDGIFLVITNVMLFVIGAVAVLMLIIGGIRYTTSGGDQGAITSAKNTILYAVVGVVVSIMAYAMVNFVIAQFASAGG